MGVGDNMSGLVWVMESTSVLVIILRIPERNKKTKNKKQPKEIQEKERGRAV